jgi:hypothetical protein
MQQQQRKQPKPLKPSPTNQPCSCRCDHRAMLSPEWGLNKLEPGRGHVCNKCRLTQRRALGRHRVSATEQQKRRESNCCAGFVFTLPVRAAAAPAAPILVPMMQQAAPVQPAAAGLAVPAAPAVPAASAQTAAAAATGAADEEDDETSLQLQMAHIELQLKRNKVQQKLHAMKRQRI